MFTLHGRRWQLVRSSAALEIGAAAVDPSAVGNGTWLSLLRHDPLQMATLRRFAWHELQMCEVARLSDEALIERCADLLRRRIYRLQAVSEHSTAGTQSAAARAGDRQFETTPQAATHPAARSSVPRAAPMNTRPQPSAQAERPVHPHCVQHADPSIARPSVPPCWIEIQLLGEDDAPIPAEPYLVELPDGQRVSGSLNTAGLARIEWAAPPGLCRVSFPRLDRDAWDELSGAALAMHA